jgi:hypothetical protein
MDIISEGPPWRNNTKAKQSQNQLESVCPIVCWQIIEAVAIFAHFDADVRMRRRLIIVALKFTRTIQTKTV